MEILMPKLGLTMTEGVVVEWRKQPGERVHAGEILFIFESEKAVMDYESPADGILAEILAPAGATVACGESVALLLQEGQPQAKTPLATPAAKSRARELGVDWRQLAGRGPDGRVQLQDVVDATSVTQSPSASPERKPQASPLARNLASDLGLDLTHVPGSGPRGRIMRADVLAAARRALAAASASDQASSAPRPRYASITPLTGVRAVIARRMRESVSSAPHVTLHTEADATSLVAARTQINLERANASKISYNALLIAILARVLRERPALNACLLDDEICVYEAINIAMAVDTKRGLVTPVIHNADQLDISAIQQTMDALIARAQAGESPPDDFSAATFTLTNLGMYEIDGFTPIINQPQAAILGVGRIISRPVEQAGGLAFRKMMTLSLSFDHRLIDGGPAAQFLQQVKQLIERPFALMIRL